MFCYQLKTCDWELLCKLLVQHTSLKYIILVNNTLCLGILVAAVSKNYTMATHINMGTNVLFSCLCGKLFVLL